MPDIELREAEVVSLKPGDVVVLHLDRPHPAPAIERLRDQVSETFPENVVLVLVNGVKLEVVSPDDATT